MLRTERPECEGTGLVRCYPQDAEQQASCIMAAVCERVPLWRRRLPLRSAHPAKAWPLARQTQYRVAEARSTRAPDAPSRTNKK